MGKGSEVKILDKSNDETCLDACKCPPMLEELENMASESSQSIFKTILHPILNIHVFIQQVYRNKSGKPG